MQPIDGIVLAQLERLPFDVHHVRTLDEYEYPLIVECRTERGETLIRYWCDGAVSRDRYLILNVEQQLVYELYIRRAPLRELFTTCKLGLVFVEELDQNGPSAFYISTVDRLPEAYLPTPDATLEGRLPMISGVQEFYLGQEADQSTIQETARSYQRVQVFQALFGLEGGRTDFQINRELDAGWDYALLNREMQNLEAVHVPKPVAYAAASPGYLKMSCSDDSRRLVHQSMNSERAAKSLVSRLDRKLGGWANTHEDRCTDQEAAVFYAQFCSYLRVDNERLLAQSANLRNAVQVVRSYRRSVRNFATYARKNRSVMLTSFG